MGRPIIINSRPELKAKSHFIKMWFIVTSWFLQKGQSSSISIPKYLSLFLVGTISRTSFQANNGNMGPKFHFQILLINFALAWGLIELLFVWVADLTEKIENWSS